MRNMKELITALAALTYTDLTVISVFIGSLLCLILFSDAWLSYALSYRVRKLTIATLHILKFSSFFYIIFVVIAQRNELFNPLTAFTFVFAILALQFINYRTEFCPHCQHRSEGHNFFSKPKVCSHCGRELKMGSHI